MCGLAAMAGRPGRTSRVGQNRHHARINDARRYAGASPEEPLRRICALAHRSYARIMGSWGLRGWLSRPVRAPAVAAAVVMVGVGCGPHIDRPSGGASLERTAPPPRPVSRPIAGAISLAQLHDKLATTPRTGQLVAVDIPA